MHSPIHCICNLRKCSHNSLMGRGFNDFWFFMAYHHLASKCFSRKVTTTQDGKGLLCGNLLLQIMLKMLDNSWCAEMSFPNKTIPSSCFGEYKCCYVIWNHQIHILITISCVKTLHVLQNQSFFSFAPLVCVFLVTASCKSVLNDWCRWFFRNPSPLTRYGQNGWYPPAWSHDASGGVGRGVDTQS